MCASWHNIYTCCSRGLFWLFRSEFGVFYTRATCAFSILLFHISLSCFLFSFEFLWFSISSLVFALWCVYIYAFRVVVAFVASSSQHFLKRRFPVSTHIPPFNFVVRWLFARMRNSSASAFFQTLHIVFGKFFWCSYLNSVTEYRYWLFWRG